MRTLLRHALTGQYWKSFGKWTANHEEAHDFKVVDTAVSVARRTNCPNLELDLRFDDPMRAAAFCLADLFVAH